MYNVERIHNIAQLTPRIGSVDFEKDRNSTNKVEIISNYFLLYIYFTCFGKICPFKRACNYLIIFSEKVLLYVNIIGN